MAGGALQEWLNRNAYRAFPFEEDSDFTCIDGKTLPNSVILDFRACLLGTEDHDVYLKAVKILEDGCVELSVLAGDDFSFSLVDDIALYSDSNVSFMVRCGEKESIKGLAGTFELRTPAKLLRSRVLSIPYGIGVDTLSDGTTTRTGVIHVSDGHNTSLDIRGNDLELTVRKGIGRGVKCPDYIENLVCEGAVLRYLNGQKADADGTIQIRGGEGVAVTTGTYKGMPAVIISSSAQVNSFMYK